VALLKIPSHVGCNAAVSTDKYLPTLCRIALLSLSGPKDAKGLLESKNEFTPSLQNSGKQE
jgi:hypothetical protein